MLHTVKIGIKNPFTNEYLLIKREDKPGLGSPGKWEPVGGGVEPGESIEEAIRREIKEEIPGYRIYCIEHIGSERIREIVKGEKQNTLLDCFVGRTTSNFVNLPSNRFQIGFFSLDEIENLNTVPYLLDFLNKYRSLLINY